jgi:dUTP pyrophosphatase
MAGMGVNIYDIYDNSGNPIDYSVIEEILNLVKPVELDVHLFREGAIYPMKGTEDASGYDLHAWTPLRELAQDSEDREIITIMPGKKAIIKTGCNFGIPKGYEVQIRPRSGLAAKNDITVLNTPGTIDSDYSGLGENYEIKVILKNLGEEPFNVEYGMRIAQAVIARVIKSKLNQVSKEDFNVSTGNREGGLGSTGVK